MSDEESRLKRQARRRLIGAVALTTFVVVTVPLIFDSEPPPQLNNDIELRIAGEPLQVETNTLPASAVVADPAVSAAAVPPVLEEAPLPPSVPLATPAASQPAMVQAEPQPVAGRPVESKPAAVKPGESKPLPARAAEAPPAKPVPKEKPAADTAKSREAPRSGYVLQVGAYASTESAHRMVARLKQLGFQAYTEKAGSTVRVRIAGYATREAAEKAHQKLAAEKLDANIIHLD